MILKHVDANKKDGFRFFFTSKCTRCATKLPKFPKACGSPINANLSPRA